MSEAKALATFDTEYTADSIEFCPHPGKEKYFTCGTYQVIPVTKPSKSGGTNGADAVESDGPANESAAQKAADDSDDDEDESTPPAPRVGRLYLFSLEDDQP